MCATPSRRAALATNSGVSQAWSAVLLVPELRAYRSAGSTLSSHWLTPWRKLATITVSATDSARLATTPATAAVAVRRWKRARCSASKGRAP